MLALQVIFFFTMNEELKMEAGREPAGPVSDTGTFPDLHLWQQFESQYRFCCVESVISEKCNFECLHYVFWLQNT